MLTGLKPLLENKLIPTLNSWLDEGDFSYINPSSNAMASYQPFWNDMKVARAPDPYSVMHEAIHAYNDRVSRYEGARESEGLAYAAEGMARHLEQDLQDVEKLLREGKPDIRRLRIAWRRSWVNIDRVGWPGTVATKFGYKDFTITVQDIYRVNSHLGFRVRCQDIAALYNKQAGASKACVEFLCVPNAKSTKGPPWTGLDLIKELSEPFR